MTVRERSVVYGEDGRIGALPGVGQVDALVGPVGSVLAEMQLPLTDLVTHLLVHLHMHTYGELPSHNQPRIRHGRYCERPTHEPPVHRCHGERRLYLRVERQLQLLVRKLALVLHKRGLDGNGRLVIAPHAPPVGHLHSVVGTNPANVRAVVEERPRSGTKETKKEMK